MTSWFLIATFAIILEFLWKQIAFNLKAPFLIPDCRISFNIARHAWRIFLRFQLFFHLKELCGYFSGIPQLPCLCKLRNFVFSSVSIQLLSNQFRWPSLAIQHPNSSKLLVKSLISYWWVFDFQLTHHLQTWTFLGIQPESPIRRFLPSQPEDIPPFTIIALLCRLLSRNRIVACTFGRDSIFFHHCYISKSLKIYLGECHKLLFLVSTKIFRMLPFASNCISTHPDA